MKRSAWLAVGVLVLAGLAFAGYRAYQEHAFQTLVRENVTAGSIHVSNVMRADLGDTKNITYKEHIERAEAAVSEVQNRIVAIQTAGAARMAGETDAELRYLRAGQGLLRAIVAANRHELEIKTKMEDWKDFFLNAKAHPGRYEQSDFEARTSTVQTAAAELQAALKAREAAAGDVLAAREAIAARMPASALIDATELQSLKASTKDTERKLSLELLNALKAMGLIPPDSDLSTLTN
jgi:hypothetical protein